MNFRIDRSQPRNAYARWTPDLERALLGRYRSGASLAELAAAFGRSQGAITSRLEKLGAIRSRFEFQRYQQGEQSQVPANVVSHSQSAATAMTQSKVSFPSPTDESSPFGLVLKRGTELPKKTGCAKREAWEEEVDIQCDDECPHILPVNGLFVDRRQRSHIGYITGNLISRKERCNIIEECDDVSQSLIEMCQQLFTPDGMRLKDRLRGKIWGNFLDRGKLFVIEFMELCPAYRGKGVLHATLGDLLQFTRTQGVTACLLLPGILSRPVFPAPPRSECNKVMPKIRSVYRKIGFRAVGKSKWMAMIPTDPTHDCWDLEAQDDDEEFNYGPIRDVITSTKGLRELMDTCAEKFHAAQIKQLVSLGVSPNAFPVERHLQDCRGAIAALFSLNSDTFCSVPEPIRNSSTGEVNDDLPTHSEMLHSVLSETRQSVWGSSLLRPEVARILAHVECELNLNSKEEDEAMFDMTFAGQLLHERRGMRGQAASSDW